MGANHQKEIEFLCEIAQPDFGYITNFGKAHLEGFGGVEGVIKGKSEMYNFLEFNNKIAFVNLDDSIQEERSRNIERISFSQIDEKASVFIQKVDANPFVSIQFNNITIHSHLIGLYNANNINAAITIGNHFEISENQIKEAIESYVPENNRSQLITKGTNEIILDAYNANPSSMKVALENFIQLSNENKVVIIGDMFELGKDSLIEHKEIIISLLTQDNLSCYFIGDDFYSNKVNKKNFYFYKKFEDFAKSIHNFNFDRKLILIKGSRGMALERTLELI